MSDNGILKAVEAEMISALVNPPLITGLAVLPAMSPEDLVTTQSLRTPSIGIIYMGTINTTPYAVGSRRLRATTKWRIACTSTNLRGTPSAREQAYSLLEGIRDRVHYLHSAQSPKACFMFQGEECPDTQPEGKLVAWADFTLDLILGN